MFLLFSLLLGQTCNPAFESLQTNWIIDTCHITQLDDVARGHPARLMRMLKCEQFDCREEATDELRAMGETALPILVAGLRHRDAEVRTRAERLLTELGRCVTCSGRGTCPDDASDHIGEMYVTCGTCGRFLSNPGRHECSMCWGRGWSKRCTACGGSGRDPRVNDDSNPESYQYPSECRECEGRGRRPW